MVGIVSYGAHIPRHRIKRQTIGAAVGFLGNYPSPGEKAVANVDEDSISMAADASLDCLRGIDSNKVDGLYFASTTQPYMIRQNSSIISGALDLREDIRTSDFVACTKAGTSALLAASDAVESGAGNFLVSAADCRIGKPGSIQEYLFGDGAAALLIGKDDVIAALEGYYSVSYDFPDRWKSAGEKWEHAWEDRWIRDEGYSKILTGSISGLLNKLKLTAKDLSKLAFCYPFPREHATLAAKLGAQSGQVQDNLLDSVGDTGTAYPLMMLIAALENAKPDDRILVASFGNGSDALLFRVTDKIEKMKKRFGIAANLLHRKELTSYEKYVASRNTITVDTGARGESQPFSSLSLWWREQKGILGLNGTRCKRCGTPQYPPNRVCVNPDCRAIDEMEYYSFSNRKATVFTYTVDSAVPSFVPPSIYGLVDFEGGGRGWFGFTDCDPDEIRVGMSMEMSVRLKFADEVRGIHNYFWKGIPARS